MLLWWAFNPLFITHHNSASYHATWAKAHATRAGEHGPGNTGQGKKVFEMWQQCVFIQIRIILSAQMYMYGKKNKNKKKTTIEIMSFCHFGLEVLVYMTLG